MFGYITPDKPNMFMKDYDIYRAFYCGLCKNCGKMYGQFMRFSINYDITFITILLHNILEQNVDIKNTKCIANPIIKKSVIKSNPLMDKLNHFNTLLVNMKLIDDINDNKGYKAKITKLLLNFKIKKAKKSLPTIADRIDNAIYEQNRVENNKEIVSIDKIADVFCSMMKDVVCEISGDKYTEDIGKLIYHIAKLIYLFDAIDDYDDDIENREFNPLFQYYKISSKEKLLKEKNDDLKFMLYSSYNIVKEAYNTMDFKICEGVVTNIIWYGIDDTIKEILNNKFNHKKNI